MEKVLGHIFSCSDTHCQCNTNTWRNGWNYHSITLHMAEKHHANHTHYIINKAAFLHVTKCNKSTCIQSINQARAGGVSIKSVFTLQ